jgi:hypothetical protein
MPANSNNDKQARGAKSTPDSIEKFSSSIIHNVMVKAKQYGRFERSLRGSRQLTEVQFGVATKDCADFGICKIEPAGATFPDQFRTGRVAAEIFLTQPTGIVMEVQRERMSRLTLEKYFEFDFFVVEEDYPIPPDIWPSFGHQKVIRRGFYPVIAHEDYFQIIFSDDTNVLSKR